MSPDELEPLSPNDYGIKRPLQSQSSLGSSLDGEKSESLWHQCPTGAAPPPRQYDDNESRKGWKPLSMEPAILMLLTFLTLLIAGAIEALAQFSQVRGGLALSRTQNEIPQYAMVSYLYVPNIVAVLYSLIWSWVDLDVKRMQPWFELSKPEGATADNSLFLDYPYDFIATVPIKAAKRRHWPVFLAGTVTVVIFWLITPLQSSIMGTGFVNRTEPAVITTRSSMVPLVNQSQFLTNQILNTGYAIGWLGQSFPPFTTAEYATLPFYIDDDPGASQQQLNWTAETTKLWTELECWPAQYQRQHPEITAWDFQNGQGCNTTVLISLNSNLTMYYVGYYTSPYADYNLADSVNCPATENSTHQFLAVWASTGSSSNSSVAPEVNVTALFCQPSYYKQQVMVTVVTDGYRPQNTSIQPISPRETLSEKEFNSTSFEFLIGTGMPLEQLLVITRDFPFEQVVELEPRLYSTNLTMPVSNMVGYALAGHNEPATPYGDPSTLHQAFNRAHQYLFAVAVNQLLHNETNVSNSTAVSSFQQSGIIVSRLFSAVVEGLLLLVAIFTVGLLWTCHRSTSYLNANPSSISSLVAIFRNGLETNELFRPVGRADEKSLRQLFQRDKFRLTRRDSNDAKSLYMERVHDPEQEHGDEEFGKPTADYEPIRPAVLRRETGLLFGTIQIGALVGIIYLKIQNDKHDGLVRPSTNFEVLQILENYIPTAFATFSEPFWVLLNRLLCLLQPFQSMSNGRSEASKSIETTYTALPPQLVAWRALLAGHFMLVMLCIVALLSNVLAVGLGALFNEDLTTANYTAVFTPNIAPRFDNQSVFVLGASPGEVLVTSGLYMDEIYVAMANITSGTPLTPWTTSDYFFQPYTVDSGSESNSSSTYKVSTRGFSVNPNCTAVPTSRIPLTFPPDLGKTCIDTSSYIVEVAKMNIRASGYTSIPSGQSSVEYSDSIRPSGYFDSCSTAITFGWGRTPKGSDLNGTMEASFAFCRPYFQTAMFDVRHDADGNVLSYERTSHVSMHLDGDDDDDQDVQTMRMVSQMNGLLSNFGKQWHNDTLTRDWMSYLLAITLDSRDFLDPEKPPPNPDDLIPTIEQLYRQLFVVLLSLKQQLFVPGDQNLRVTGQKLRDETRIFVDQDAFIITATVLCLNIIAVVVFYSRGVVLNLPRVPTTIGSILAFVSASHILLDDADDDADDKGPSSPGDAKGIQKTYSFGRYIGVDQKVHLGIDMDPHVALADAASSKEKRSIVCGIGRSRSAKGGGRDRAVRSCTWL